MWLLLKVHAQWYLNLLGRLGPTTEISFSKSRNSEVSSALSIPPPVIKRVSFSIWTEPEKPLGTWRLRFDNFQFLKKYDIGQNEFWLWHIKERSKNQRIRPKLRWGHWNQWPRLLPGINFGGRRCKLDFRGCEVAASITSEVKIKALFWPSGLDYPIKSVFEVINEISDQSTTRSWWRIGDIF